MSSDERLGRPASSPPPAPAGRNVVAEPTDLDAFFLRDDEALPAPKSVETADPLLELLLFSLGSEGYALAVPLLREIVMPPPLSEVPRAPAAVLGVTMLRGEVVPVIDPRLRLRLPPRPRQGPSTRVIIVDAGAGPLGLWVDRVVQVVRVRASGLETPPPGVASEGDAVIRIGRHQGKLYGVLDLRLLAGEGLGAGR